MNASFPPAGFDTEAAVRDEVLARFGTTEDPRLREIMLSLIRHLHAFVGETKITWPEWERAMAFLATAARVTGPGREVTKPSAKSAAKSSPNTRPPNAPHTSKTPDTRRPKSRTL